MSPVRSWSLAVLVTVLVSALGVWPGNIPLFWSACLGVAGGAVTLLATRYAGPLDPLWRAVPDPAGSATDLQAANLAGRLAEAAVDQVRFVSRVQPRLRALAEAAVRERGLSGTEAADFLGPDLAELISSPHAELPPPHRAAELLARLEKP
ncbi:hypothetical protein [Actinokineospora xionganensis]|uniref:Uncharacterized protein n=1 Tax=Actinokineospora xionganensis TaxID=2684470 RepID=A0ABR7LD59_9PSEU|nr:hypothetical protein [Actinokineospora xionganensis]MBC6450321.1 hypothetical protein [Actinokineospora xionganensis]